MRVRHKFVSANPDGGDTYIVGATNLNADHDLIEDVVGIGTNTTATASKTYIFTASLTLTLPPSPSAGDFVKRSDRSGTTTCVIDRNALGIMGLSENMNLDTSNSLGRLTHADATRGWALI